MARKSDRVEGRRRSGDAAATQEVNRVLYAEDCLNVLNDPLALPPESVDLIYLDPPFNSKSDYNLPFKGKYKSAKPVAVFTDTWRWGEEQDEIHGRLAKSPATRPIAQLIDVVRRLEGPATQHRLDAYLVNMAERLIAMRNVLKPTGSIYLHCDPTASHYLKALMDLIFGKDNFRNEIIWRIGWVSGYKTQKRGWIRNHDTILYYLKTDAAKQLFNKEYIPYPAGYTRRDGQLPTGKGIPIEDTWNCSNADILDSIMIKSFSTEKLGYPTQKSLALLERIIRASSNEGDLVLDPFAGCGTSIHAAEALGRRWIGIDVARFSAGLVKNRVLRNFSKTLSPSDVRLLGVPETPGEARELAAEDKFEFEKWACGAVGAEGMFHEPGTRGPDSGVDGVVKFYPLRWGQKPDRKKPDLAIVQVKGGEVTPDAVKALDSTVRRFNATAGVIICFKDQMGTVENQRLKDTFDTATGPFPVIQGLSVEDLLRGKLPNLPYLGSQLA